MKAMNIFSVFYFRFCLFLFEFYFVSIYAYIVDIISNRYYNYRIFFSFVEIDNEFGFFTHTNYDRIRKLLGRLCLPDINKSIIFYYFFKQKKAYLR